MFGFESPFPGNPTLKKPSSLDDLYADMRQEISRSRIICPYPPGTSNNFRDSALIISDQHRRVRYRVQLAGNYYEVTVYDLEHIVAAAWLRQEEAQFQYRRRPMTDAETIEFLSSLTPDDTAWRYTFSVQRGRLDVQGLTGRTMPPDAEWFAAVIASAMWDGVKSQDYVMEPDNIPDCPTVPAPKARPHYTTRQPWRKVRGRAKW